MKVLSDVPCRFILNSPLPVVVYFFTDPYLGRNQLMSVILVKSLIKMLI